MVYVRICLLSGFLLAYSLADAQKVYSKVVITDGNTGQEEKGFTEIHANTLEQTEWLNNLQLSYWEQGFYGARFSNRRSSSDTVFMDFQKGKQYGLSQLSTHALDKSWKIGLRRALSFKGLIINELSVLALLSEVLNYGQNNGYPFTTVWIDSFS